MTSNKFTIALDQQLLFPYRRAENAIREVGRLLDTYPAHLPEYQKKSFKILKISHSIQATVWDIAYQINFELAASETQDSLIQKLQNNRHSFLEVQENFNQALIEFEVCFPEVLRLQSPDVPESLKDYYQPRFLRIPSLFRLDEIPESNSHPRLDSLGFSMSRGRVFRVLPDGSTIPGGVNSVDWILPTLASAAPICTPYSNSL